jgi:hypothetical protein
MNNYTLQNSFHCQFYNYIVTFILFVHYTNKSVDISSTSSHDTVLHMTQCWNNKNIQHHSGQIRGKM